MRRTQPPGTNAPTSSRARRSPRRSQIVPRKPPQQARAQATVEVIIQAAERILDREGTRALTTNRLAEVAGVSIGSVYQYFPGKDAVIAVLVQRYVDDYHRLGANFFAMSRTLPLDECARRGLGLYLRIMKERPTHLAVARAVDELGLRVIVECALPRWLETVRSFLAGRDDVRALDLDLATSITVSAVEAVLRAASLAGLPRDEPAWIEATSRLIVAFLAKPA